MDGLDGNVTVNLEIADVRETRKRKRLQGDAGPIGFDEQVASLDEAHALQHRSI